MHLRKSTAAILYNLCFIKKKKFLFNNKLYIEHPFKDHYNHNHNNNKNYICLTTKLCYVFDEIIIYIV